MERILRDLRPFVGDVYVQPCGGAPSASCSRALQQGPATTRQRAASTQQAQ